MVGGQVFGSPPPKAARQFLCPNPFPVNSKPLVPQFEILGTLEDLRSQRDKQKL